MQGPTNTLRELTGERRTSRGTEAAAHQRRSPGYPPVRDLAERLVLEYRGAVPPGRVSATVYRAYLAVLRERVAADRRLEACERIARRKLTDLLVLSARQARARGTAG